MTVRQHPLTATLSPSSSGSLAARPGQAIVSASPAVLVDNPLEPTQSFDQSCEHVHRTLHPRAALDPTLDLDHVRRRRSCLT